MSRRKTHEEFIGEMININPNIEIVGKYKKHDSKIDCECIVCGNTWSSKPNNLLNGRGCPKCSIERRSNIRRKTQEQFVEEMKIKNPNIEILGQYINNQTPIKCRCKICGCEWESSIPVNLLKCSYCCPECFKINSSNRERMGDEEYCRRLKNENIPLLPIEKYINNSTPILHKCSLCGGEHKYAPNSLLQNKKCVICQGYGIVVQYGINSLADTHPEIASMVIDKELSKKVSAKSVTRTDFICKNCGTVVKNKEIRYVVNHGLSCQICSDGISYPMKFVTNVLEQLNVEYRTEVSFKNWYFDFDNRKYIPRYDIVFDNYIIEVDGGFHKRVHNKSKLTLNDIKYIDSMKDKLAVDNGYKLIRIAAYESDMDYMKNSIINSTLSKIYNLKEIRWDECHKNSIKSYVKEVCDIWNNLSNPSVKEVHKNCGYNIASVRRWLKIGAKINLCNYDPKKEMIKNAKIPHHGKSVICLNYMKTFKSLKDAAKYYNINHSESISRSCKNRNYSGGKDPKSGKPLFWMYYEDYIKAKVVI